MAPLQLGDEETGFLLGNFVIVTSVLALIGIATGGAFLKFNHDAKSGKEAAEDDYPDPTEQAFERTPIGKAMDLITTPGAGFTVIVLAHQGISLESFMLLNDPESSAGAKVLAVIGVLYSITMPAIAFYWLKKRFRGLFATYRYVSVGVPLPLKIFMPNRFWLSMRYAHTYGTFFKTISDADLMYAAWDPLGKITLVSFIAGFDAKGSGCQAQYGSLAMLYVLEALYRIIRWPHLTPIGNIGPLAAALTTALISSSQGFGFEVLSVEVAMVVQSYLSISTSVLKVVITLVDEKIWQPREIKARYLRNDFDWGGLDMAIDEKAKKLLDDKAGDSDSAKTSDGDDDGGERKNPLLKMPERQKTSGKAAAKSVNSKADAVPDTSSTLAALLAMKAEREAALGGGRGGKAKKPQRKGRRPADDSSSEEESSTSDDSDL